MVGSVCVWCETLPNTMSDNTSIAFFRGSALEAFQAALVLEKHNNSSLLALHALAAQHNDAQVYIICE